MNVYEMMDEARLEAEQADRKAAEAWRFRHHKSVERQFLETGVSAVVGFLRDVRCVLRAGRAARPDHEQPVY